MTSRVESVVRAAVLGLLALSPAACGGSGDSGPSTTTSSNELGAGEATSTGSPSASDTTAEAAETDDAVGVLSSQIIADVSLEDFTETCDEAAGVVETHDTCAGQVSGPGFSYDVDTDVYTEHTCRGFNTCVGFSCVVDS